MGKVEKVFGVKMHLEIFEKSIILLSINFHLCRLMYFIVNLLLESKVYRFDKYILTTNTHKISRTRPNIFNRTK